MDPERVLIVDDDESLLYMMTSHLERQGYSVESTPNPFQGLELVKTKGPFAVLVTDLMMPGIDGFGLVEELRLDPRTKNIPVVVVSAKDITPEERKRLNGHIEAVYQKSSLPARKFVEQMVQVIEDDRKETN